MAAALPLSKAEYLKRYLSRADAGVGGGSESILKRRKKRPKPGSAGGKGMRIVDDDVSWTSISTSKPEPEEEEDDGDLPVVAEFVDERPEEVKQMETFRSSAKWKLLGDHSEDLPSHRHLRHDCLDSSPPRRVRHDTPDPSPPRRVRVTTPRILLLLGGSVTTPQILLLLGGSVTTPQILLLLGGTKSSKVPEKSSSKSSSHRKGLGYSHLSVSKNSKYEYDSDLSPPRKKQAKFHFRNKEHDSKGSSPSHRKFHSSSSPRRHQSHTLDSSSYPSDSWKASDSDLSPPRNKQRSGHQDSDSDLSLPRNRPRHRSSDSDLSPPRRKQRAKSSDSDLSPPRRTQPLGTKAAHMYSGAKTGLVLTDVQREQQELKKRDQETMAFEGEFQYAETIFRDKSGRKRNLKLERLQQRRKAEKDSERDELYAQWGKGLVQNRQQQQNVEDAIKEMQKPLARYIDDEDLDRMLREQEREGDPMANFIKKNKAKENKNKKVRPRYSGPAPPPNRFNIWPGYRWDGVDRSNGFEQKRFARLASKKAVEELAYKWSVEDM
ncbi:BUD13-like protein [Phyllostomus discolor]|uniref:BUD13 homolog n=2 Tax=Phyllostomus discolor TaxID=89673 RepID=A0A834A3L0_9CHIR|nr:BUD13-like protein [Phyllostomus discolor]